MQTIDIRTIEIQYVDVNERHVFVCEPEVLRVFSRTDGGNEVLRIERGVLFSKMLGHSEESTPTDNDPFVSASVHPIRPEITISLQSFIAGAWVGDITPDTFIFSFVELKVFYFTFVH